MNPIKHIVNTLFHPDVSEYLLKRWVLSLTSIAPTAKTLLVVVHIGMKLHRAYNSYLTSWVIYYLRRDTSWVHTESRMHLNAFCPDSARGLYSSIIFNQDPKDLQATLNIMPWTKKLTECYKQRQARCGFASLL